MRCRAIACEYELFKYKPKNERGEVPDVPFQMLTALDLGTPEWTAIARRASWQMTRMNLNTFARHGVFGEPGMTELIADRPYRTVQATEREDILNVGGFSDQVFDVISEFARGELNADHWVGVIESVTL